MGQAFTGLLDAVLNGKRCCQTAPMRTSRLEAFSDGVLAIIITIMVLELKVPDGADLCSRSAPSATGLLTYLLSFVYIGIYWNNHHHMFQLGQTVDGAVLWANLHLLFWLSLSRSPPRGWTSRRSRAPRSSSTASTCCWPRSPTTLLQRAIIARRGRRLGLRAGARPRPQGQALAAASTSPASPLALRRALARRWCRSSRWR